jgi:outer membrane protein TolC
VVKTRLLMMATLLFFSNWALATFPLTLEQAIQTALKSNADLKTKEAAVDAANGTKKKLSAFLPSSTRIGLQGASDLPFANEGEYKIGAKISQELEIAGQITSRKEIGAYEVEKAEKDLEWFKNQLVFQVQSEFYQILYLEKKIRIGKNLADSNRKLAQLANTRKQQRVLTEFDSDLWHFEDVDSFSSLLATKAQLNEVHLRLKKLLGDGAVDVDHIEGHWPTDFSLPTVEDALAYALANRADIERMQAEIKQRTSSLELAKRSWVPNPELSLSFDTERSVFTKNNIQGSPAVVSGFNSLSKSDSFLGVGISVPLNLFIGKDGEVAKACAETRIARFEKMALEADVIRDVRNFWQQFELAGQSLARYSASESKLENNVKLLQEAYQKGNIDLPTYLNYRDRLIKAQLRYAEAQWTHAQAWTHLQLVSGRILGGAK